ncbi:hypothetical protein GSU68_13155 [Rathayibacter sp. VKM Ac-2759]|uniref:hypothetical protein n=1 Tax=Rathayibacter sp. VKM Ac-2759 TaxID=2609252 RepID=UPI001317E573|nr:hypothetical protein [Rathayibacter sp. VKM Ac-2759]QHC67419.1 hypothetical protein GSU68_13155 [Rathayibacter sp. VKM Ac-2759]
MAISRTTRTALELIDALRVPGGIDPRLARQVASSLRQLLEAGTFGPSDRVLRRRSRRMRAAASSREAGHRRFFVTSQGADTRRSAV